MSSLLIIYILWLYQLVRFYVKRYTASRLKPIPPLRYPLYNASQSVSVIVPTIDADSTFAQAFLTWVSNSPLEIIVVTTASRLEETKSIISKTLEEVPDTTVCVRILEVALPGKRKQMAHGIQKSQGQIIVFTDDDVFWPPSLLPYLLACFEDPLVGGVGTKQHAHLPHGVLSVWQYLAARRLRMRNSNITSGNYIDGGVTCLSGRTSAYRAEVLKDTAFIHNFTNDYWCGKTLLDSGDDTFLTRWLFLKGWEIKIQTDDRAKISTVVVNDSRYLLQLVRWSRNSRRSYIRCLFFLSNIWKTYPYLCITMTGALLKPILLCLKVWIMIPALMDSAPRNEIIGVYLIIQALRIFAIQKVIDWQYFWAILLNDALSNLIDFYSLATLDKTGWGTRDLC